MGKSIHPRWFIATSGASQVATVILLGTVLAVYVGEEGSPFAVSMVFGGYFFAKTLFGPVWGAIADITGKRKAVLMVTMLVTAGSLIPLFVVTNVWVMVGVRVLVGAFSAGYMPIMLTIVSQKGGSEVRGQSLGFFTSMRSVGFTAAQALSGLILGVLFPRGVFLVIAGVGLFATVSILFVDEPDGPAQSTSWSELPREVVSRIVPTDGVSHLTENGLHWLYVTIVLRNTTWHGLNSLLPVYILLQIDGNELFMGILLAMAPLGEIFGMYLLGRRSDSLGRKPLIVAGVLGHAAVCVIAVAADFAGSTTVALVVLGTAMLCKAASFSSFMTGTTAFIGDVSTNRRESELMGLRTTAIGIGGVLGPTLVGTIATLVSYTSAFLVAGGVAVVATVLVNAKIQESHHGALAPVAG